MKTGVTLQSLDVAQRKLVQRMQEINFGRIENLPVRNGMPVVDPPPRVVQEIKFAAENGPRPERCTDDFVLKSQVRELLAYLEQMKDGVIECLVVKHGLPFSMNVRDGSAAAA